MLQLLRIPHGFLRRYLNTLERMAVAAMLAGLVCVLLWELPSYPPYWDAVILVAIFAATLWSLPLGYFLAIAAAAYPLYHLSIYLAALFLAVALLGARVFIRNLGGALLVLATPLLAIIYLPWVTPVLGGLWWGAAGGALMGGLAALWGQVLAGMAGMDPDWVARLGLMLDGAPLVERFAQADSLETLLRIVEPLAPDPTTLLFYLLQVIAWVAVGALVGAIADRAWAHKRHPWGAILAAWLGVALLAALHQAWGLWLQIYNLAWLDAVWKPILFSLVSSGLAVSLLEGLRDFLEHPLPYFGLRGSRLRRDRPQAAPSSPAPLPLPVDIHPGDETDSDADDLIMLELD
ncbi:MAG: hypothetical protein JXA78_12120 [Anaerolineales bacterium]|nr:hypothetical protein [Anaerolineales bacterium]